MSFVKSLYSSMVILRVGSEKEELSAHKDLLCREAHYFKKALDGPFLEARTHIIELDDILVLPFKIFLTWLYTGKLMYTPSDPHATAASDIGACVRTINHCLAEDLHEGFGEEFRPDHSVKICKDDGPDTWPFSLLIQLFMLGDRLDCPGFRDATIDALIGALGTFTPLPHLIKYVYETTTERSPFRKVFVHHYAWGSVATGIDPSWWMRLPPEFMADVLIVMARRLPVRLCKDCHSRAYDENAIASKNLDYTCETGDSCPLYRDSCIYHDHKEERAREVCRRQRDLPGSRRALFYQGLGDHTAARDTSNSRKNRLMRFLYPRRVVRGWIKE